MTETPTVDFFNQLEHQLREAAPASTGARPYSGAVAALLAALAVGAFGLFVALLFGGDNTRHLETGTGPGLSPVGTVLPKGSGDPPREHTSMVVAAGRARPGGPWQLEVSRYPAPKHRDRPQPFTKAGMCLMLYQPSGRGTNQLGFGGYCGPGDLGFRKTPGFSRAQTVAAPRHPRAVVMFGRAPSQATRIVVVAAGGAHLIEVDPQPAPAGFKQRFGFDASFYGLAIRARKDLAGARVNWLDESGRLGSRGIRLMPPLIPQRR
jgi:hypothetical protein